MKVHIHRGQNQIGGNIIEIATETTKIILDVGLELDQEKNKVLPKIEGLFDCAGYDAVFISHYHGDHIGLAYHTHKEIPIYIGEASYKIIKVVDDYKKVNSFIPKGFLHHGEKIVVGDITVTPFLCDHSAFDSYMLLCESDDEKILYTGDFRSNGRKSFNRLLHSLPQKVDKLICEGTTLSREGYVSISEKTLEEKAVTLFRETPGPVFVLQSTTNIDRIVTMYRAAKRSARIFLEEVYMAEITSALGGNIPNPSFEDVYAFLTLPQWYDWLCKHKHKAGKDFIAKRPFVMCVRDSMLHYLQSLSKEMSFKDGILVYSFWSGYRETERMKEFLQECENLGLKIVTLHTSGHADENTIKQLIDTVKPKMLIPVHTENADKFKEIAPGVMIFEQYSKRKGRTTIM